MKVLLVTQYFWPEGFTINELATSLVKYGVEVKVLTGKPNYPEGKLYEGYRLFSLDEEARQGVSIQRVPIVTRGIKNPIRLVLNYLSFIVSACFFGPWLLRKYHPDVVFVYAPSPLLQAIPALLIGKLNKIPVVLYVQDLWPESLTATGYVQQKWIIKCVSWVVKHIYRSVDSILISSRSFEEPIRRFAAQALISYLPNSVDIAFTAPQVWDQVTPSVLDDGFVVIFAGNIGVAQAVWVMADAADRLVDTYSDIKLVILGAGSELAWLKKQKQEKKLANLHLLGRFPVEAMPLMLSKASALLITLADQPIFAMTVPNKTQAYMAVGRPILAALNGEGAKLVTEAKAGIAVAAEDPMALAEAIVHLYKMTEQERLEMGMNGKRFFLREFEQGKVSTALLDYLNQAVKEYK
jgi:glycosyltransferase involved in cell wall biosynthesis